MAKKKKKSDRVLIGCTGSWAGHMARWHRGEKGSPATPIYVSRAKYKKLKEWEETKYLSGFSS